MIDFRDRLEKKLDTIEDLPALPPIVLALEQALQDEKTDAEDIANIVSKDPSLAAKLLKLVNSAAFGGAAGEISSISQAVARLGFKEVSRLFTALAVIQTFDSVASQLDHKRFWQHCLTAGFATRVIKRFCSSASLYSDDEAYLAGLLHDVGILVLDQVFPKAFAQICALAKEKELPYPDAEHFILKLDHGDIGGMLLRRWKLPDPIVEAVSHHHHPSEAAPEHRVLAQAVHLAEFVCTCLGIGDAGDGFANGFSESAWHDLGLSVDDIPRIIEAVTQEAELSSSVLSL